MQQRNNNYLKNNKTIRQIISLAMLLLFVVNITPKKTLHLLFGCHRDVTLAFNNNKENKVSNKSFHCSCNQADIQTPFVETAVLLIFVEPGFITDQVSKYTSVLYAQPYTSFGLRGPPSPLG